ncbi:MAG: DUF89 domain-containing protein [Promethearchaeota archaeon]
MQSCIQQSRQFLLHLLMEYLLNFDINEGAAPVLGKVAYNIVADIMDNKDPYHDLKMEYNQLVLDHYEKILEIVEEAEDPLFKAILASALGNTIDFATQHDINIISDLKKFKSENLVINDYEKFLKSLQNSKQLLILGDNAGEIVFDKILIIILKKSYPDLEIIYSVRSTPIINDSTLEDAEFINLTEVAKVIESNDAPGIILSEVSKEFKDYFFNQEGVILSKGQGNFESLYGLDIPQKDLYYVLKAKCNLMERIFCVKIGALIFKKKEENF